MLSKLYYSRNSPCLTRTALHAAVEGALDLAGQGQHEKQQVSPELSALRAGGQESDTDDTRLDHGAGPNVSLKPAQMCTFEAVQATLTQPETLARFLKCDGEKIAAVYLSIRNYGCC